MDAIFLPDRNHHALLPGAKPSHSPWAMEWAGVVPCPMLPQHPVELRLLDLLEQSLDIVWQGLLERNCIKSLEIPTDAKQKIPV
nr:hypothetical protein [Microvirga ossetica]